MLVLTRQYGLDPFVRVILDDGRVIDIHATQNRGDRARIGLTAPADIGIYRSELLESDGYPRGWVGPRVASARLDARKGRPDADR